MTPAHELKRYRDFIQKRDLALERLHVRAQAEVGDQMRGFLSRILMIASHRLQRMGTMEFFVVKRQLPDLERLLMAEVHPFAFQIHEAILRMRRNVYLLSKAGEAEALTRVYAKPKKAAAPQQQLISQMAKESPAGGSFTARIELAMHRIIREVIDAVEYGAVIGADLPEIEGLIKKRFPKTRQYIRPPRALSKLKEADRDPEDEAVQTVWMIDDEHWQAMLSDYERDYVPRWRGPEYVYDLETAAHHGEEAEEWYGWEIEQEMTQDFVEQVRAGQVDAARENGIEEFIWVSVLDSATDLCCRWRNGLTTAEINTQLEGKHQDDECRADVPPAHFNCRCTLSPVLKDLPKETPPDFGAFEDWLAA